MIYKIKSILGVGVIRFKSQNDEKMVSLIINNKDHLKNFIFPIFDKYPMFSNKQYDYLRVKNSLLSNLIYSKDLPEYVRQQEPLHPNMNIILNSFYFSA